MFCASATDLKHQVLRLAVLILGAETRHENQGCSVTLWRRCRVFHHFPKPSCQDLISSALTLGVLLRRRDSPHSPSYPDLIRVPPCGGLREDFKLKSRCHQLTSEGGTRIKSGYDGKVGGFTGVSHWNAYVSAYGIKPWYDGLFKSGLAMSETTDLISAFHTALNSPAYRQPSMRSGMLAKATLSGGRGVRHLS